MKSIPLTPPSWGLHTTVDDADYDDLAQWSWRAHVGASGNVYAYRIARIAGKRTSLHMARYLLNLQPGDKRQAHHKNHNTLDNQRANLAIKTQSQHKIMHAHDARGISYDKARQQWHAYIGHDGHRQFLGRFATPEEAADARQRAIEEYESANRTGDS